LVVMIHAEVFPEIRGRLNFKEGELKESVLGD
jgi:hypothetical protein